MTSEAIDGPGDINLVRYITRLYLVVHARPPDPDGLRAFVKHLRNGSRLADLAVEFLESQEFRTRVQPEAAAEAVCRAGGLTAQECADRVNTGAPLLALVMDLVTGPDAPRRLPLLPALYPEGVPIDDAPGYRLWLAERSLPAEPANDGPVPAISFIMLLRRPNREWLMQAAAAAMTQPEGLSELVVAAPGWLPRPVRQLTKLGQVTLVTGAPWAAGASLFGQALRRARGRMVALIGQHDRLDPAAASHLCSADADVVLADDDRLDAQGRRHSPRLGAAWDPDQVMAAGCPGLVAIRTELVRRVGGMRALGGFSERALLLRAVQACGPIHVTHLPAVLLSRREEAQGGSLQQAEAMAADHGCTATAVDGAVVRLARRLPDPPPLVSVIIPTRDRAELLRTCTDALLRRTSYPALEVVIVDNGSVEPAATALLQGLAADPRVRVVPAAGPFNWSVLNNSGVAAASGTVIVLLNNDTDVIDSAWLDDLVTQAMRPEVGAVGAKLLYPDRRVQHAGITLGPAARGTHVWRFSPGDAPGYLDQLGIVREVSAVTGACLAMRRDVYQAVGGCDATLAVTWNDVDLCLRVRQMGLRVIWTPYARLLHLEQASRGSDEDPERQARYQQARDLMRARWGAGIDNDPFMSPHLIRSEGPADLVPRLSSQP